MAKVASLEEQVMLGILLLGFRIGDAKRLKKNDFNLNGDPPIELKLRAKKEGTVYETFISEELRELLEKHIPTLEDQWLFSGVRKGSHVKDETLNNRLKNLAQKAGIKTHGNLTWHCGRKLVMRTGAELGLNIWNIKRMVGKSIPISDDTYLTGLKLREDFIKFSEVLRLKPRINRVGNIEELTQILAEVVADLIRPKLREKLLLISSSKGRVFRLFGSPSLGGRTSEETLKLYLQMKKEGRL
ncbi:MAG: hypothetical protein ACOC3C_05025 [Candidatus Thorarchaeota archaeon]